MERWRLHRRSAASRRHDPGQRVPPQCGRTRRRPRRAAPRRVSFTVRSIPGRSTSRLHIPQSSAHTGDRTRPSTRQRTRAPSHVSLRQALTGSSARRPPALPSGRGLAALGRRRTGWCRVGSACRRHSWRSRCARRHSGRRRNRDGGWSWGWVRPCRSICSLPRSCIAVVGLAIDVDPDSPFLFPATPQRVRATTVDTSDGSHRYGRSDCPAATELIAAAATSFDPFGDNGSERESDIPLLDRRQPRNRVAHRALLQPASCDQAGCRRRLHAREQRGDHDRHRFGRHRVRSRLGATAPDRRRGLGGSDRGHPGRGERSNPATAP